MSARPTVFGGIVVLAFVGVWLSGLAVTDPAVAGIVTVAIGGFAVCSAIWSIVAVAAARISVVSAPTDAVAGDEVVLRVEVRGGAGAIRLQPRRPSGPLRTVTATEVDVVLHDVRRCVLGEVRISVLSYGPFGVLRACRDHDAVLPRQLHVAPSPIPATWDPAEAVGAHHEAVPRGSPVGGDTVRGVRPYVRGDPAHLVHWPSSARLGELVVRELEAPVPPGLAVVVDLGDGGTRGEEAASRAAGLVDAVLGGGGRVVVCTRSEQGPGRVEVQDRTSAGRALAAAVPGRPASAPMGWVAERVTAEPDAIEVATPHRSDGPAWRRPASSGRSSRR